MLYKLPDCWFKQSPTVRTGRNAYLNIVPNCCVAGGLDVYPVAQLPLLQKLTQQLQEKSTCTIFWEKEQNVTLRNFYSVESLNCGFTYTLNLTSFVSILTYNFVSGSGFVLGIRIRIQKAPEYRSNTDPDPQHCIQRIMNTYYVPLHSNLVPGPVGTSWSQDVASIKRGWLCTVICLMCYQC